MGIKLGANPPGASDRAWRALDAIGGVSAPVRATFRDAEGGGGDELATALAHPIPIYAPAIGERDASSQNVVHTGWRYLVVNSENASAIDVGVDGDSEPQIFQSEQIAMRLAAAANQIEARVDSSDNYELRLLDLNLIGDSLLWLHAEGGSDRYFSFDEATAEYGQADVDKMIAEGAERFRAAAAQDDHPEAGG